MPENQIQRTLEASSALVEKLKASPNFGDRPSQTPIDMVILHYTGMESSSGALAWLCDAQAQVSSHYFIDEGGCISQLVDETRRAWHAGISYWRGERDINSRSIGIEIANPGHNCGYVDFPPVQMRSVVALVGDIVERNNIPPANILAHSDIAPLRKKDPGELFDWRLLHNAGLGIWVEPSPVIAGKAIGCGDRGKAVRDFQINLGRLGFEITADGIFDELTLACTRAFQRHFRPQKVDGIADISTHDTLKRLLAISQ